MNDPKARSRKKTVDEIQRAIVQLQADQGKLSISAVPSWLKSPLD